MRRQWLQYIRAHWIVSLAVVINLASVSILLRNMQPVAQSQAVVVTSRPVADTVEKAPVYGMPTYISVPAAGVDVKILPGTYDQASNSWTLSDYNAHVATMMAPANNIGGNTFIYGHNNKHVFGPLQNLRDGAKAEVITDNGHTFLYTYQKSTVTEPNDVSLFTYEGPPILTLQTCTGSWHEKRQLLSFKLESVVESPRVIEARKQQQVALIIRAISTNAFPVTNSTPLQVL